MSTDWNANTNQEGYLKSANHEEVARQLSEKEGGKPLTARERRLAYIDGPMRERVEQAVAYYNANGMKAVYESPLCIATTSFRDSSGRLQRVSLQNILFQRYQDLEARLVADATAKGENANTEQINEILRAHLMLETSAHREFDPGQSMKSLLQEWSVTPNVFKEVEAIFNLHSDAHG